MMAPLHAGPPALGVAGNAADKLAAAQQRQIELQELVEERFTQLGEAARRPPPGAATRTVATAAPNYTRIYGIWILCIVYNTVFLFIVYL